jgi:hypothetical protein
MLKLWIILGVMLIVAGFLLLLEPREKPVPPSPPQGTAVAE